MKTVLSGWPNEVSKMMRSMVWTALWLRGIPLVMIGRDYEENSSTIRNYIDKELERLGIEDGDDLHKKARIELVRDGGMRSIILEIAEESVKCKRGNVGRNEEIYKRYQSGESIHKICREYSISPQRIDQIVVKEAAQRGEILRERVKKWAVPIEIEHNFKEGRITLEQAAKQCNTNYKRMAKILGVDWKHYVKTKTLLRHQETLSKYELVYQDYIKGMTCRELAKKYNSTKGSIDQLIMRYCKETNKPMKKKADWEKARRDAVRMYKDYMKGMTILEVAKKYNSSVGTVQQRIYRHADKFRLPLKKVPAHA